jgi:hypothetical protein
VLPESDRGGLDGEGRDCEEACMSLGVAFAHCPRSHLVDTRLRNATGGSTVPMNGIMDAPTRIRDSPKWWVVKDQNWAVA